MKHKGISSFLIDDLAKFDRRPPLWGVSSIIPKITAAASASAAALATQQRLAEYIRIGEKAQGLRHEETLRRTGLAIQALSGVKHAQTIGSYYVALSLNRRGPGSYPEANKILLKVADNGATIFRAKARVALSTNSMLMGDHRSTLELDAEAVALASECKTGALHPVFFAEFHRAFIEATVGDHRQALADFESLMPLARLLASEYPATLAIYYNSLALELAENGRLAEANLLSGKLQTGPLVTAYPEFRRTHDDIAKRMRGASRSSVAVTVGEPLLPCPENVVTLPVSGQSAMLPQERSSAPSKCKRAKVLDFSAWKAKMNSEGNGKDTVRPTITRQQIAELTIQQKQALLLKFVLCDDVTDEELERLIRTAVNTQLCKDDDEF
jgi:hypothetical protein